MTVQELIDELHQVKDKEKIVKLSINDIVTSNFHLNDKLSTRLYLSNAQEEGYKTTPLD